MFQTSNCSPSGHTITMLKQINKTTLLIPFEQLYIQSYYHHIQLILEQNTGE
jgi:hypothetical protein